MASLVITACVLCAATAFGVSLWTYMDVSMFGFPDGYVTDYQKAADTPLKIIMLVEAGLGLLFSALVFSPVTPRMRLVGSLVALIALVLVGVAGQTGVPWYFGVHLGLDNGIGG